MSLALTDFRGLGASDARAIAGEAHLRQSIADILTTPLGSRVMRRDYGSRLFELIDRPVTGGLIADVVAATAEAIRRWEPRVKVSRVLPRFSAPGRLEMDLELVAAGRPLKLDRVL